MKEGFATIRSRQTGMTLVGIGIIILIVGLLATALMPVFGNASGRKALQSGTGAQCGTRRPSSAERQAVEQAMAVTPSALRVPGSVRIGVVFHVIASASGQGDAAEWRLDEQINVLNRAFSGQDRPASGQRASETATANTPFRFYKQEVRRYYNDAWFFGDFIEPMDTPRVGGAGTLNVYIWNLWEGMPYVYGFSSFPTDYYLYPDYDGVHIDVRTVPGGGGSLQERHPGDTLVHEVGHWLGLYHTFNDYGGCVSNYDGVEDTPAEWGPYYGTPPPYKDSCTGPGYRGRDPIENFMDYTDDAAMYQFTPGQSTRMEKMARRYRGL